MNCVGSRCGDTTNYLRNFSTGEFEIWDIECKKWQSKYETIVLQSKSDSISNPDFHFTFKQTHRISQSHAYLTLPLTLSTHTHQLDVISSNKKPFNHRYGPKREGYNFTMCERNRCAKHFSHWWRFFSCRLQMLMLLLLLAQQKIRISFLCNENGEGGGEGCLVSCG